MLIILDGVLELLRSFRVLATIYNDKTESPVHKYYITKQAKWHENHLPKINSVSQSKGIENYLV
ncbi:MAG: hypothetical protein LBS15_02350 [Endomicrobium sp.]|jgi:hypothetical protein|nr:hypothetical protein [Endomicrobium sp.]